MTLCSVASAFADVFAERRSRRRAISRSATSATVIDAMRREPSAGSR
jgi:hypothetical protein